MKDENAKKSHSKMQLIIIEPNQNLEYYDISKIGVHKFDDELCVVPAENIKEYIPITFKRSFIHQSAFQRIICIDECESDPKKYFLTFSTVDKCINFIESIKNNQRVKNKLLITVSSDDETFKIKYLAPILKIASENSLLEELLKSVLSEILQYYKPATEMNILQIENSANENESSNSQNQPQNDDENISTKISIAYQRIVESDERRRSLRKRPVNISYQDVENEKNYEKKNLKRKYPTKMVHKESEPELQKMPMLENIIHAPNFEIFNYIRNGILKSRLFIFPTSDKSICYEFYHRESKNQYFCSGCYSLKKEMRATIEINSNGIDYVKCHRIDHICELRKFEPEKFQSDLIIKKPNYQFIEEERKGKTVKSLLIFTSKNMKNYYKLQYINRSHSYLCTKCDTFSYKGTRKYITANIGYDKDGNEIVYVRNIKHVCSKMKYLEAEKATIVDSGSTTLEPKNNQMLKKFKHQKTIKKHKDSTDINSGTPQTPQNIDESKIIRKPYYQLFQRKVQGRMCQKLAVFDSNDLTMCHELTWSNFCQKYVCHPCKNYFRKNVFAKIIKNGNEEEEYVQMGECHHHCSFQKFQKS